jgi:hypothetical protein
MKKFIVLMIIIAICFIQTTTFAFSISDSSNNGVRISVLENVKIDKETRGSVITVMGDADIQNNVNGDLIVVFGNVTLNSKVSGNVVTVLGTVKLTDKAEIGGDFISVGNVEKSNSAVINGNYRTIDIGNFNLDTSRLSIFIILKSIMFIVFVFFVFLLGFPFLKLFNKRFKNISQEINYGIGKKFSIGLPGFVICFATLILLGITGIVPLIYFFFAIILEITVSIFTGKILLNLFNSSGTIYMQFILGLVLLELIKAGLILLIFVNGFTVGIALCFGFDLIVNALGTGILIDSQFGRKEFK